MSRNGGWLDVKDMRKAKPVKPFSQHKRDCFVETSKKRDKKTHLSSIDGKKEAP